MGWKIVDPRQKEKVAIAGGILLCLLFCAFVVAVAIFPKLVLFSLLAVIGIVLLVIMFLIGHSLVNHFL